VTAQTPTPFVSTFTPNLALEIPAYGDYATTGWGTPMDASLNQLDTAYGGYLALTVTGGTLQLTQAQASNPIIALTGTLTADQFIYFPPIAGRRLIIPDVDLNGFTIYVQGNNGADQNGIYFWNGFGIPYGIVVLPYRVMWDYGGIGPGTIADFPSAAFPGNGWLPLDGRWAAIQLHDILYDIVGATWGVSGQYFQVGDFRGTTTAMADQIGLVPAAGPSAYNAGNRGILNNYGVMTFAGEANHLLATTEMPSHTHPDAGHIHPLNDPGHGHIVPGLAITSGTNLAPGFGWQQSANSSTQSSVTGISIATGFANIQAAGGGGAHNNIQPTTTTMKMIRW
jgi:microcystin-dependent protein